MRPLEWIVVLAFSPLLLSSFVPQRWRRRLVIVSAPLPVLASGLQIAAEGWRVQMLPVYLLAVALLLVQLPALLGRDRAVPRGRAVLGSSITALLLVVCAAGAGWLLPVITLPAPTGPYQVGIVDRELVDATRGRRLMVSVWYPAAQHGMPAPLTQHPDAVATALEKLSGVPGIAFQYLRYVTLDASVNVPVLASGAPFPIVVFSHGLVGLRLQNSSMLQELASWGYVVVAIDHTDAAAVTVFPDGEARFYNLASFGITAADGAPDKALINKRVFPVWVADQRFVYDTLETWALTDPLFAGNLDVTRIGSFGHSFGGATALEVCRVDSRCRAAIDMDGALYGAAVTEPAVRPLLLMSSAESGQFHDTVQEWMRMIANAHATARWFELPHSTHLSFTITQLLSPLLVPKDFDPRVGLRTVDTYARTFFDRYVRNANKRPFESACSQTDVQWFTHTICE